MIKSNGDWTWKLIDKLYKAKRKILISECIKIEGIDDEEIFNILLQFDGQKIPESRKFFYPIVHISWPVTAAAQSAALRKFIIMIGAGSGIAPYLSFIEDES